MSTIVERLVSLLQFETDDRSLGNVNKALDAIKGKLVAIAAVAAPAALAKVGFSLLKEAAGAADVAAKTARTIGITTESYQELTQAAAFSGVKQEELNVALRKLSKNAYDAANGNKEMAKTFRAFGLDVKAMAKLKPDEQIERLADAYTKIEDPGKRAQLMMKLLEEAGPKFASMFAGGGAGIRAMRKDAQELGMIIPDDLAVKAEAFNDSMDRLRLIGQGMKYNFILPLLESIQPLLDDLTKWRKQDAKAFAQSIKGVTSQINDMIKAVHGGIQSIRDMTEALGGFGNAVKLLGLILGSVALSRYVLELMVLGRASNGLLATNLKLIKSTVMLALPYLAVAAILAALVLVVEDFYRFASGDSSLLEEFIGPATPDLLQRIQGWLMIVLGVIGLIALAVGAIPILMLAVAAAVIAGAVMIYDNWEAIQDGLSDIFLGMYNSAVDTWDDIVKTLNDAFMRAYGWLERGWDSLVAGMSETFYKMIDKVKGTIGDVVGFIEDPFGGVARFIGGGAETPALDMATSQMALANSRPQQTNYVNVQVDGSNLSEDALRRSITSGVNDGMLREADRAFSAGPGGS